MVCGDLNSRVENKKDFIDDNYMFNKMSEDEILENVITRNIKERSINENGKQLFNFVYCAFEKHVLFLYRHFKTYSYILNKLLGVQLYFQ